ncbi:MAG: TSUP family transporter, partial [Betaproteobacteria bacterium]
MEFSAGMLALILLVAFGSAIVGGMGGFGTGIMLTATLTPILGIKAVVPILAFAGIIINSGRFWFYRNDFNVAVVKRVLPPALLFLVGGTFIDRELDAARLAIVIGIVVLMSVPLRRFLTSR